MRIGGIWSGLLVLWWALLSPAHAGAVELEAFLPRQELNGYLEVLEDPQGTLTLADVQSPEWTEKFTPAPTPLGNLGFSGSTYWFRVQVHHSGEAPLERWLVINNYYTNQVDFYPFSDQAGTVERSGSFVPVSQRTLPYWVPVFAVTLQPGEARLLHWRVQSVNAVSFPLVAMEPRVLQQESLAERWVVGLFMGVSLFLALQSLLLFRGGEDVSFLCYSLFLITYLIYFARGNLMLEVDPHLQEWILMVSPTSGALSSLLALLFFNVFLNLRRHLVSAYYLMGGLAAIAGVMAFLPLGLEAEGMRVYFQFRIYYALVTSFALIAVSAFGAYRGIPSANYLFAGALAPLIGFALISLESLNWIPRSPNSDWYALGGLLVLFLLLSGGLVDRFRHLRQQQLEAEQQVRTHVRELERLKDHFYGSVASDWMRPLQGSHLMLETVLQDPQLPPHTRERLSQVRKSSARLMRVLGTFLKQAKGEGALAQPVRVMLQPCLEEAMQRVEAGQPLNQVLVADIPPELPAVWADPMHLTTAVQKLLEYGLRQTQGGVTELKVEVQEAHVQIVVHCSGPRLSENNHSAEGLEASESGAADRLAPIRRQLAEQGYELQVTGAPDEERWGFELPCFTVEEPPQAAHSPSAEEPLRYQALLVDDEPASLFALSETLLNASIQPTVLTSAAETRSLLAAGATHFDVILLDQQMPGAEELYQWIQEHLARLPVILMTVAPQLESGALAAPDAVGDLLVKPFTQSELLERLQAHLQSEEAPEPMGAAERQWREDLTALLRETLQLYMRTTGKSKADFAEATGWGAHLEGDTWRTRGLDQYLDAQKLPQRVRLSKVTHSVQQALSEVPESPQQHALQQRLEALLQEAPEASLPHPFPPSGF